MIYVSPIEYVNVQELKSDMKSITDRAAQTLLWTELIRGEPWALLGWAVMAGPGVGWLWWDLM